MRPGHPDAEIGARAVLGADIAGATREGTATSVVVGQAAGALGREGAARRVVYGGGRGGALAEAVVTDGALWGAQQAG